VRAYRGFESHPFRQLVDCLLAAGQVSIWRAFGALQAERSRHHYRGKRTGPVGLEKRIKEIAETRVRKGYRRITAPLKRKSSTRHPSI
jgi:putative transposase